MSADLFKLTGKKIIVTGASSGIGYETCILISQLGGSFIGIARRKDELEKLLEASGNTESSIIAADLTKEEDILEIVKTVPNIDGVVHSAGITQPSPLKFYKKELIDKIREVNYDSILLLLSNLVKHKKVNKNSSVVLVSSISGLYGMKGNGIYAGTKGAMIAIAKVWANELAVSGIRVNVVAPGMVRTDITLKAIEILSSETIAEDEKKYPLGYGDPIDVAAPITFLLSSASKWITGEVLIIDGGRTMTV